GQVVGRAAADEDVVAGPAPELVGPAAADEDVAAAAARKDVGQVVADEDVIALTAGDVLDVADAAGEVRGGAQCEVDTDPGDVRRVVERVGAALAVEGHDPGLCDGPAHHEGVVAEAGPDHDRGLRAGAQQVDRIVAGPGVERQPLRGPVVVED